mmetsp:Transcript_16503/g.30216  ORF Transcript_16503/g.30216 Transcript_16503/m.30216 type:complete len:275 (+) Transcript_16503:856-1680(+)
MPLGEKLPPGERGLAATSQRENARNVGNTGSCFLAGIPYSEANSSTIDGSTTATNCVESSSSPAFHKHARRAASSPNPYTTSGPISSKKSVSTPASSAHMISSRAHSYTSSSASRSVKLMGSQRSSPEVILRKCRRELPSRKLLSHTLTTPPTLRPPVLLLSAFRHHLITSLRSPRTPELASTATFGPSALAAASRSMNARGCRPGGAMIRSRPLTPLLSARTAQPNAVLNAPTCCCLLLPAATCCSLLLAAVPRSTVSQPLRNAVTSMSRLRF